MELQTLLEAIALRDAVRAGRMSRTEIQHRVRQEFVAGNWSRGQIATIVGYTSQGVGSIVSGLQEPQERPVGGKLDLGALDLALLFYGAQTRDQRRNLLDACIRTGTSTRLLSRITGAPLSTISYRRSRMKGTP